MPTDPDRLSLHRDTGWIVSCGTRTPGGPIAAQERRPRAGARRAFRD